MHHVFRLALAVGIVAVSMPSLVYAVTCSRAPLEAWLRAPGGTELVIFEGTAVRAERVAPGDAEVAQRVLFRVDKAWQGNRLDKTEVVYEFASSDAGCPAQLSFTKGKTYLVFASRDGDRLTASADACLCSTSSLVDSKQANDDKAVLQKLFAEK